MPEGTDGSHALIGLEALGGAGVVVVRRRGDARSGGSSSGGCRSSSAGSRSACTSCTSRCSTTVTWLLGDWNWPVAALIGVPLALLAGWGFFRVVEKPLHRLARAAKRGAGKAIERYVRVSRTA